ncbi:MAG: hypothetical protein ACTS73_00465 [Arsenophonus sp. NEOnobi-MAG3]
MRIYILIRQDGRLFLLVIIGISEHGCKESSLRSDMLIKNYWKAN